MEKLQNELITHYKTISRETEPPEWVQTYGIKEEKISPAIPFVGDEYGAGGLLVYASAENLNYLKEDGKTDEWIKQTITINRYRECYDDWKLRPYSYKETAFPQIHISPFNNGPLFNVAAFVLNKLQLAKSFEKPEDVLKNIACANFGKFSIKSGKSNQDYAGNIIKLKASFDYIFADLSVLKPKYVVLPKTIFKTIRKNQTFNDMLNQHQLADKNFVVPQFIPIYQISHFTINSRWMKEYKVDDQLKNEIKQIIKWGSNGLKGKTSENFDSHFYKHVLTELNKIINK